RETSGEWSVEDLGSANGTFVDVQRAKEPLPLKAGNRVRFGFISFYFVADASRLAIPQAIDVHGQTARPFRPVALERTEPIVVPPPLRNVPTKLLEPSGGGGGVIQIDGRSVHLTVAQYELVSRLIHRMLADSAEPVETRGYISSDQLIAVLSLDSLQPNEDNVRQLVRRVRRRFLDAGLGDVIESRYGLGYRLNITPHLV